MRSYLLVALSEREAPEPYVEALKGAGAEAESIRVVDVAEEHDFRRLGARAAGVVLCGGHDLAPEHYGEEPLPGAPLAVMAQRDHAELDLLAGARDTATPVWGICRGLQVINVFQGGSLWQDIPMQVPSAVVHHLDQPRDALVHPLDVAEPLSPMGRVLSREPTLVNSRHHQAVKEVGRGLRTVARSPDGLAEVLVLEGEEWWIQAVQWHPENLTALERQRALWRQFLDAAERAEEERG